MPPQSNILYRWQKFYVHTTHIFSCSLFYLIQGKDVLVLYITRGVCNWLPYDFSGSFPFRICPKNSKNSLVLLHDIRFYCCVYDTLVNITLSLKLFCMFHEAMPAPVNILCKCPIQNKCFLVKKQTILSFFTTLLGPLTNWSQKNCEAHKIWRQRVLSK